jgi:hypothetical protein
MIDQATIARYQPGGDIYATLEDQYGRNAALLIAQAAQTGDRDSLNEAIAQVRHGAKLDDSTAKIFWQQITTDPFDAPLDSLNKGLGTVFKSAGLGVLKNPWVLLALALVVFFAIGGHRWLFAKAKLA